MGVEGPINQQQPSTVALSALNRDTDSTNNTRRIETQAVIEPTNNQNNEHQSLGERVLATGKDLYHRAADTASSASEKLSNVLLPLDDMDDEKVTLVKSPEEQKGQIWQAGGKDNVPVPAAQLNKEQSEQQPTLMKKAGQAFEAVKQKCNDAVESVKSTFSSAPKEGQEKSIESKETESFPDWDRNEEFNGQEQEKWNSADLNRSNLSESNKLPIKDTKESATSGIFVSKIGSTISANSAVQEWEQSENIIDDNEGLERNFADKKPAFNEQQNALPHLDAENFPPLPGVEETKRPSEFREEQQPLLQRELDAGESNRSWADVVKSDSSEENISAGPGAEGATDQSRDTLYGTM